MAAFSKFGLVIVMLLFCLMHSALAEDEGETVLQARIEKAGAFMGPETCAECHSDHFEQINNTKHGKAGDPHSPFADWGCETCHGPGGNHVLNDAPAAISFVKDPAPTSIRNAVCLHCHQGEERSEWHASIHESEDLACNTCHSIHKPDKVLERTTQTEVCYTCHKDKRAQSFSAYRHPIREAKVICSDCHNPHGSIGEASLKQYTINENCYTCHAEKRGPFLFEHPPATEDCALCHQVHGSNHPAMLVRQAPQLCQSCHSNISGDGSGHTRFMQDFNNTGPRARFVVGQNCTNCHNEVHGSNHPSGSRLQR